MEVQDVGLGPHSYMEKECAGGGGWTQLMEVSGDQRVRWGDSLNIVGSGAVFVYGIDTCTYDRVELRPESMAMLISSSGRSFPHQEPSTRSSSPSAEFHRKSSGPHNNRTPSSAQPLSVKQYPHPQRRSRCQCSTSRSFNTTLLALFGFPDGITFAPMSRHEGEAVLV